MTKIGWILLGIGVLVIGGATVKVVVDQKNEEKMLQELEKEYQERSAQNKVDEGKIYRIDEAKRERLAEKMDEQLEDDDLDLTQDLDLRIDDEEDLDEQWKKANEQCDAAIKQGHDALRRAKLALG